MVEQANEKRLRELVDRWEELRAQGVEPSEVELCKDAPELLGELQAWVRAMKATDWLSKPAAPHSLSTSGRLNETLGPSPGPSRSTETKPAAVTTPTLEVFVSQLTASGLMSAADLQTFRSSRLADKQPADATTLARELVQQGKLTRFQATAVFQNKLRGLVFGDYVVLDRIGAGGMGQVYKARHGRMDRIVAIKVLPNAFSKNVDSVKRFQREVKTAARLNHPHIVTAYDAGEQDGGAHYLVMEYVEGSDLSSVVKTGGPMPVKQAIDCVLQAARGLEHAHAEGIIHRDIKPSNLLLDKKGTVKILDMGLARVDSPLGDVANDGLTNTGNIMGTIDYMAPEQALDTKHADHRADIYGLGCTLYFLLTGKRMYDEDTVMKKLLAHREGAIPSLMAARPEVSANLEAVFQKMVAKRPADRFQSMREARAALDAAQGGAAPLLVGGVNAVAAAMPKGTALRKPAPQQTAANAKPTQPAKPSSRGLIWGGAAAAVLLALGLGGYLLRGVIFKYETPAGTVIVEVDQPGTEVKLDGKQTLTLVPKGSGEAVEVRADVGKHMLEVRKGGFKVYTKEFVVNDGKPNQITVRLEPLANVATKPPETAAAAGTVDRDRHAAEWAIGAEGHVTVIRGAGTKREIIGRVEDLPPEAFRLVTVDFWRKGTVNSRVTDESLANLDGLEHLEGLILDSTSVTDAVMKRIAQFKTLVLLNLAKTQLTDAGFAELRNFPGLTSLSLDTTKITGAGLASIEGLTDLRHLGLGGSTAVDDRGMPYIARLTKLQSLAMSGTSVSDAGIEKLKQLADLSSLVISGPNFANGAMKTVASFAKLKDLVIGRSQIDDEGLESLAGLKDLKRLVLEQTQCTPGGVASLQAALPNCKIEYRPAADLTGGPSTPPLTAGVLSERDAALWALEIGGKVFVTTPGNLTPRKVENATSLPSGNFHLNRLDLSFITQLTDDDLRRLAGLKVTTLQLRATNITDAGLQNLTQIGSLGDLSIGQTKTTTAGLAHLASVRGLGVVNLADGPLDDAGLAQLNQIKSLAFLYIPDTAISDAGVLQLKDHPLKGLTIGGPLVTDASLNQLLHWKTLELVGLRTARVTEAGLARLAGLPNLKRLELQGVALDNAAIERLRARLPGCTINILPDVPTPPTTVLAGAAPPAPSDPAIERKAAEWALSVGGKLSVQVGGRPAIEIARLDQLPPPPFTVFAILIDRNPRVDDSSLAVLRGLSRIVRLELPGTAVTDRGMNEVRALQSLTVVGVSGTAVGDAGIEQIVELPRLEHVYANNTQLTDHGARSLARSKTLRTLHLINTRITDEGLAYLAQIPLTSLLADNTLLTDAGLKTLEPCVTFEHLSLNNMPITDAGAGYLAGMLRLRSLQLRMNRITDHSVETLAALKLLEALAITDTQISHTGYEKLQAALPGCKIEWSQAKVAVAAAPAARPPARTAPMMPAGPAAERQAAQWVLEIGGKVDVATASQTRTGITAAASLPAEPFRIQVIELTRNNQLTEAGLANLEPLQGLENLDLRYSPLPEGGLNHIRGLTTLKSLRLRETGVTDAALTSVTRLNRLAYLELHRTKITDVGLASLRGLNDLNFLRLDGTQVGNAGMQSLRGLASLATLDVSGTNVDDAGLEALANIKSLRNLVVGQSKATEAGFRKLHASLPWCEIRWDGGTLKAAGAPPPGAPAGSGGPKFTLQQLAGANRLPVPSAADQQKALATLKDVFKDDFAAAKKVEDKVALAEKLLKQAEDSLDDPAVAYTLIGEARNLASDAADAPLAVRLVSELGSRFQVDPLELLADDLEKATQKSHPSASFRAIADTALEHIDEALGADQFPLAKRLSDVALAAARKAKDPATLKTTIDRNKGLAALKQQWDAAQAAQATLAKTPDEPDANLALGRYLCFTRGDWAEGFAHLARGGDATLKELAAKSVANPQDAAGQAELGEAWAQAADAAKGKSKAELQAGARYWYTQAAPALSGLAKVKAEQRLKQLGAATAGSATSPTRGGRRTTGNPLDQLARDRAAAEWALSLRAKVGIMAPWLPEQKMIELASELPPQPFALTKIDLFQSSQLTDNDLAHLEGLINLRELRLEATPLTNAGLEHIKDLTNLISLNVSTTQINDAGLINLRGLKNLQKLWIGNRPPVTDAGLEQLKDLNNLSYLSLSNTRISDAGLAVLKNFPRLEVLLLNITPVTDGGLDRLRSLPSLTELDLSQTQITDAGLAKLSTMPNLSRLTLRSLKLSDGAIGKIHAALPNCKIQL